MQINFKELLDNAEEVTGGNFDPLPVGEYIASVDDAEWGRTGTDKDKLVLTFTITEGPHKGRKVWSDQVVSPESPKALGFFFRALDALGAPRDFISESSPQEVANRVTGSTAKLKVGQREWKGQVRNEVRFIDPAPNQNDQPPATRIKTGSKPPPKPFNS